LSNRRSAYGPARGNGTETVVRSPDDFTVTFGAPTKAGDVSRAVSTGESTNKNPRTSLTVVNDEEPVPFYTEDQGALRHNTSS
jgi:hypothetical protein